MNTLALPLVTTIIMGLGATLTFDLWGLLLKRAFGIAPSNICLVGRWVRYMPEGTFIHASIATALPKRAECVVGWVAHYTIGVVRAGHFEQGTMARWCDNKKAGQLVRPSILFSSPANNSLGGRGFSQ